MMSESKQLQEDDHSEYEYEEYEEYEDESSEEQPPSKKIKTEENNNVQLVKPEVEDKDKDEKDNILDGFSTLLQFSDLEHALKVLVPNIEQSKIYQFMNKEENLDKIMPIVICTAILKEKEQNGPLAIAYSIIQTLLDTLHDFIPEETYNEIMRLWDSAKPMLTANTSYSHKYLCRVKSMTSTQIQQEISSITSNYNVQHFIVFFTPIILKIIFLLLKDNEN